MRSLLLLLILALCSAHVRAATPADGTQPNSSPPQTQQASEKKSDDSKGLDPTTVLNLLLTFATGVMTFWTSKEQKKATYLQFYEIISRHHSSEITALRREVFSKLEDAVSRAKQNNQTLLQEDPAVHLSVSTLANYYEAIGMFLQGGWNIFPKEARNTMLEMLHNSVTRSWTLIDKYKDDIYPNRASDWAGSFQWLYHKANTFRQEKGLA